MAGVKTTRFLDDEIPVIHPDGSATKAVKRKITIPCLKCAEDLNTVQHLLEGKWRVYRRTHKKCQKYNKRNGAGALGI